MSASDLKNFRLESAKTQQQVAEEIGTSQPSYQRWESGTTAVPSNKLKLLAKALGTTVDKILGKSEPFDLSGVDETIPDDRTYFGEAAIHFSGQGKPLLLPISEATRTHIHKQFALDSKFIEIVSLDNQMVFIRTVAIQDMYISSKTFDTYGPETYDDYLGIFPDDRFWDIVEYAEYPEGLDGTFDKEEINSVFNTIQLSDERLDELVKEGKIKKNEREKHKTEADAITDKFFMRANYVVWQYSNGSFRKAMFDRDSDLYDAFFSIIIEHEHFDETLILPVGGYHRNILVNTGNLDYISVPAHKIARGLLDIQEQEIDTTEMID